MGLIDRLKTAIRSSPKNTFRWGDTTSMWHTISSGGVDGWEYYLETNEMSEITYYICVKILAESVGKLSVHVKDRENNKVYDADVYKLLKVRPNDYMTPTDFKTLMEYRRNHYGNAYAYIERDGIRGARTVALHPLDNAKMRILVDNDDTMPFKTKYRYEYEYKGRKLYYDPGDIIHLKGGLSDNPLVGKSVREELASTIRGAESAQRYLNRLYDRGLTANAILQYTGDLSQEKKARLVKSIKDFTENDDMGNIVPIPFGMDLKPLDIKLTDAQFHETRKFTALQIAAAFGIKPNHLNNYDKSSYANSEMQNLSFYVDTLLYILKKWEEELDYKLLSQAERERGLHVEFNVSTILRGDLKTQAEALNRFVTGSIYTPNEARGYLGLPPIDDGDEILVNGTYTDLASLGSAYQKGGGGNIEAVQDRSN